MQVIKIEANVNYRTHKYNESMLEGLNSRTVK